MNIDVIDAKGGITTLTSTGQGYYKSQAGLIEAWFWVDKDWLHKYPCIPIPIFTEWWEN